MKDAGAKFDPSAYISGRGRLLHGAQRPDAELPVQQLDHRSSTTTRTPSRPPASTPTRRPPPGPKWSPPPPSSRPAATSARSPPPGRAGPSSRASRPGTTSSSRPRTTASAACDARLKTSTRRCTCATSRTWPTWPSRACSSTRAAATCPRPASSSGECAMINRLLGLLRHVAKNAKFAYGLAPLPYYPDVHGRAAEHRDRRRQPVGDVGQEAGRVQGRGRVLQLPLDAEVQSASHKRTGYLPITTAAYQLTEKSGFYKENPGTDVAVTQMIRKTTDKIARHPPGQLRADPHHRGRGTEQVWAGKKARQGSAGRDRQARQRTARTLPEGEQELSARFAGPRRCAARRLAPPRLHAEAGGLFFI